MEKTVILGFDFALEDECLHAKMAYADLLKCIALRDSDRAWYSLKALLRAVADIAKTFWPITEYADRGNELRRRFSIPDDSVIQSRKMRNRIDHFDEYFQDWMKDNPVFQRGGVNYGYRTMLPLDTPQLGFLDCPTMTIVFLDETWRIEPVIRAIEELSGKVEQDIRTLMH